MESQRPGSSPAAPLPPRGPFSPMAIALLVAVGIFAGLLTFHVAFLLPFPPSPYGPTLTPDRISYQTTLRVLGLASAVLMDVAVAASVGYAWFTALGREGVAEGTRRGLLTFAAVLAAVWIAVSALVYAMFRSFFFY